MTRIGVLTSGGDAQGMNAAIYAVVRCALARKMEVFGILDGYQGLIDGRVKKMTSLDVDGIIHKGGTILGTARCNDMKTPEGRAKAVQTLKNNGIDSLVVIGGDGSFQGARILSVDYGINVVGIPGTIDNDLAYTDFTLGFDSAVTVVIDTVKMLRDTMSCNGRSCVVEVMGRNCGDIAMYAGATCGAEVVIVPEVGYNVDTVVQTLQANHKAGKMDNIIIVAEGVGTAEGVRKDILERMPQINIRSMVAGHIQRGGQASFRDRLLGVRMGECAVEALAQGKTNRVVGIVKDEVSDFDMLTALATPHSFNDKMYALTNMLVKF